MSNFLSISPKNNLEKLLKRSGYQILGRNQKGTIITRVNARDHLDSLPAEFTVRKGDRNYAVVVGTSEPTEPGQRRRLLEYERVFGLDGVLLVNPEAEELHEVSFRFPRERGLDFYFQFLIALFIVFLVVGIIWLLVQTRLI